MKRGLAIGLVGAAVLAALAIWDSLVVVPESTAALIVRLGRPVDVVATPGLIAKWPLIDTAIAFDMRLLLVEPPAVQVILGDQKRIEVQTYARFRVADPLQFYKTLRTVEQARAQLAEMVSSSVRRELGEVGLPSLTSSDRVGVVSAIEKEVVEKARPLGVEVAEVRILRADLPEETSQAIYDRMKSERQREAKELRAQGYEWAQQIEARADRERTVLLSEAERDGAIVKGEGDAQAGDILADAFGADKDFYRLYRSIKTYHGALADSSPTLVLSPASDFLKILLSGPTAKPPETPAAAALSAASP
jgi:membrane protease subunit HflC